MTVLRVVALEYGMRMYVPQRSNTAQILVPTTTRITCETNRCNLGQSEGPTEHKFAKTLPGAIYQELGSGILLTLTLSKCNLGTNTSFFLKYAHSPL